MHKKCGMMLLFLGACAATPENTYLRNVKAWLGRTPTELTASWGKPTQTFYKSDGTEYLVYMTDKNIYLPGVQDETGNGMLAYDSPLQGTSAYDVQVYCQTTFLVRNNRIVDFLSQGNDCRVTP